jgi:hypothetical protein
MTMSAYIGQARDLLLIAAERVGFYRKSAAERPLCGRKPGLADWHYYDIQDAEDAAENSGKREG